MSPKATSEEHLPDRPYHRFVRVSAACVAVIIAAGALVTTTRTGLSVPDWPTTFGTFFPPFALWVNGVEFEHTHRLIAGVIGLFTMISCVWVIRRDARRGVRFLAGAAICAVLVQAMLGGLTVLLKLPPAVSASHGTLGQTFFCLMVALSMVTSPSWAAAGRREADGAALALQMLSVMLFITVWSQLVIGATMRHLHAGLAILDFPTSQGQWVPDFVNVGVAVNFAHRMGALVVFVLATSLVALTLARFRDDARLVSAALRIAGLVALQVTLGAFIVWTHRSVIVTSLHVLNGALVLVSALVMLLWAFRLYAPAAVVRAARPRAQGVGTPAVQGAVS